MRLDTHEAMVAERAQRVRLLEAERLELIASVREAHRAGATIQQLIEWTGYSRRTIYYMLEETKP